jgi:hypothetical protein
MWNPFKKSNNSTNDPQQMGMLQRLTMKKVMNMNEEERMKLAQKVMTPENINKNKDKFSTVLENMKASGQITEAQFQEAKRMLGL